jgi:hypothetical protein
MKKRPENHAPPNARIRFLSPSLRARAGLSATLRGQPGPALRRQKSETSPKRRLNEKLSPCNDQRTLCNHRLF